MNALAMEQTYTISEPFDKAVKLIRLALAETELSVVDEFDMTRALGELPGKKAEQSRALLVDCPLLVFESEAFDGLARVVFALHALFRADGYRTRVSTASSGALYDARLPSGVAGPLSKLK